MDSETGNAEEEILSLDGHWFFRLDENRSGESEKWYQPSPGHEGWQQVTVPHTWQISSKHSDYFGWAWYRKDFYVPSEWQAKTVRIEFEAVFHSARVWLNGTLIGGHARKGYTAFFLDMNKALRYGENNTLSIWVDNSFDDRMLPRNHSYDWAADGGITRPVNLHITEPVFIERTMVTALPDIEKNDASVNVLAVLRNASKKTARLKLLCRIEEEKDGRKIVQSYGDEFSLPPGASKEIQLPAMHIQSPKLWHFDHPHLYKAALYLYQGTKILHRQETVFGIKKIEVKQAGFYLNGERVKLMGVERMAGSNPDYGMAEPLRWIEHDHRDMKELNCVFTRVHWQQDKRVLDFCDRHGILIQLEVPTWGGDTFRGMTDKPDDDIMQNGLEQLREQVFREYNHPCIFSWGLCNEIGGQNAPAYQFARNMLEEAKKLDPHRLCSYASNSLQQTPGKDVSALMDFVEWNEYYESWYNGTVEDMEKNLQEIHEAFPDKPIVISEYGWCRCTPDRKEGDTRLVRIMKTHDEVFRKYDYMGGLIFFCYNDYRTHIGDKGAGVMKQRVHGVVDLYGAHKPSYEALRAESSPVEDLRVTKKEDTWQVALHTRRSIPSYNLKDYTLKWVVYADQDIPVEKGSVPVPSLHPGDHFEHSFSVATAQPEKIVVTLKRPTGFSVADRTIQL